jgi:hypothetical protein
MDAANRIATVQRICAEMKSRCMCDEMMEDDDPCGALCPYCEAKNAKAAAPAPAPAGKAPHLFQSQIEFVRDKVSACEEAVCRKEKVAVVQELFDYIVTQPAFLARYAPFRNRVVSKAAELYCEPECKSLHPTFARLSTMVLYELPLRDDWRV